MRNINWLRYGLASLTITGAATGALLVACGDDSSSNNTTTTPDSGTPETGGPAVDTDSGADAGQADAGPPLAKITIVGAAADLGPNAKLPNGNAAFRVCFKAGSSANDLTVAPYPPLPDKSAVPGAPPGIYIGTGGTFPSFGVDLEPRVIQPIIMNAYSLAKRQLVNPGNGQPGHTCDEILGTADAGGAMQEGVDYWTLPAVPAGTFKKGGSYLLALTGCPSDTASTAFPQCGSDYTGTGSPGVGNLKVQTFELDKSPVDPAKLGVQFAHLSPQAQLYITTAGGVPIAPGFVGSPDSGADFKAATSGTATYPSVSPAMGVTGVTDLNYFAASKDSPSLPGVPLAPVQLPLIQAATYQDASVPTIYKDGKTFVFIAVGDPTAPTYVDNSNGAPADAGADGSAFNTKVFHYLAFPTDPDVPKYTP